MTLEIKNFLLESSPKNFTLFLEEERVPSNNINLKKVGVRKSYGNHLRLVVLASRKESLWRDDTFSKMIVARNTSLFNGSSYG